MTRTLPLLLAALVTGCPAPDPPAEPPTPALPQYADAFTSVTLDGAAPAPLQLAVQACAGLRNRALGGSVFVAREASDTEWLTELDLQPSATVDAADFLASCVADTPCVRYDYADQQELLPSILTAATAVGAIPLDDGLGLSCTIALDAVDALADAGTVEDAARWALENHVGATSGLAMLNPGYQIDADDLSDPPLIHDMSAAMVDFVFSERLFVTFFVNGCEDGHPQRALLSDIVNNGVWQTPVGVYGYNDSWLVGGYLHEAQTRCLESANMGAIPTKTGNLSFFSTRRAPITAPGVLQQNPPEDLTYDPTKTYVAFIIGDGDNVRFIMSTRNVWLRQRLAACAEESSSCAPLTWSISPHLPHLAPDVLEWYYARAEETANDFFTLPPSGHTYAYPTSLNSADQDRFVALTEADARLLDLSTTVHWDWFETWGDAEFVFLPKYARADGAIRGLFPVNVPYLFPTFPSWSSDEFFRVLAGADGGRTVLFRPRQWRGINDDGDPFFQSPQRMADELAGYPQGTVTGIYMTSDGGLSLENSFLELVPLLPPHVEVVSADTAARLALDATP